MIVVFLPKVPAMFFANIGELKCTLPVRLLNIYPDLRVPTEIKILTFHISHSMPMERTQKYRSEFSGLYT